MKQFALFFYLLLMPLYAINHLDWIHSYKEALEIAQKNNKDIYLFIGADRCHFCKMYMKVLSDNPQTLQMLKNKYVLVYLSRDRHDVPGKFEKYGVPRHYFLTPKGEIYFADAGTKNAEGIFLMIDEAELYRAKE
jgi:uncharacterized protein YyaL (SSP411 family)